MQPELHALVLAAKRRIEDRIPDGAGNRPRDVQCVDAVAEEVQHPHRIAKQRLRVEIGVGGGLDGAVRRHQITQIERERRPSISGGVAGSGNLLVGEMRILQHLEEVEVDARALHAGDLDVRRRQRHRRIDHHAVTQQRAERPADCGDGGMVGHGSPATAPDAFIAGEAARALRRRAGGRHRARCDGDLDAADGDGDGRNGEGRRRHGIHALAGEGPWLAMIPFRGVQRIEYVRSAPLWIAFGLHVRSVADHR